MILQYPTAQLAPARPLERHRSPPRRPGPTLERLETMVAAWLLAFAIRGVRTWRWVVG